MELLHEWLEILCEAAILMFEYIGVIILIYFILIISILSKPLKWPRKSKGLILYLLFVLCSIGTIHLLCIFCSS